MKLITDDAKFPSQVFVARTLDPFTKKFKAHLFVIWYSQSADSGTNLNNNIYALRITTKTHNSTHLIEIPENSYNKRIGLKKQSYIICDEVVTFNKQDIHKVLGQVDFVTWLNVIKERQKMHGEEMIQNMIAFSNIKYFK